MHKLVGIAMIASGSITKLAACVRSDLALYMKRGPERFVLHVVLKVSIRPIANLSVVGA